MNFDLSEEQQLLQETVRQLLVQECPPTHLREIFDGETGFDPALWKGLVEMGLGGIQIPEAYGGAGLELLDLALVVEQLGFGAAPVPLLGHALAALAIERAGSEAQKQKWLPALATGDCIATLAFCEDGDRWQPEQWALAGGTSLSGVKTHVPFASTAGLVVVGVAGGGLAVVEAWGFGALVRSASGR